MSSPSHTIEEPTTCRVCGTENDHHYTYCRNCLTGLPAQPDSRR